MIDYKSRDHPITNLAIIRISPACTSRLRVLAGFVTLDVLAAFKNTANTVLLSKSTITEIEQKIVRLLSFPSSFVCLQAIRRPICKYI
ncbi:hypothetical protein PGT21_028116 [Puccinia graminis f. sp. tritici]|uniref:Uncharacterized protein n=1 Tax=Puccinia graminis f. sp. tritici TaxID=56615 RepID=A0A5B0NFG3_PUCGR|nr:hypothetical protein PGT21_028116 [Puccinia graminis f. sp. tritici]